MPSLAALFEKDGLPAGELPGPLFAAYGPFGLAPRTVYANFVSTVDGIVAIPSIENSPRLVSLASEADRLVMGLLRAHADAVLVGASTANSAAGALFTADQVFPAAARSFEELRRRLDKRPRPEIAIVSGSGSLEPEQAAVANGALVITSARGAERLAPRLPDASELVVVGDDTAIGAREIISVLEGRGHRLILSEGGPHLLGSMLDAGVIDELFLTLSPRLVGRASLETRLGLVEGADVLERGERATTLELVSARRHASHLFLRYYVRAKSGYSGADVD